MPSVHELTRALDERVAIGDLTPLVNERIINPIEYIGLVATEIAQQFGTNELGNE